MTFEDYQENQQFIIDTTKNTKTKDLFYLKKLPMFKSLLIQTRKSLVEFNESEIMLVIKIVDKNSTKIKDSIYAIINIDIIDSDSEGSNHKLLVLSKPERPSHLIVLDADDKNLLVNSTIYKLELKDNYESESIIYKILNNDSNLFYMEKNSLKVRFPFDFDSTSLSYLVNYKIFPCDLIKIYNN